VSLLTEAERFEYGQRADTLLPNQIVYSLTSVEGIVRARLAAALPAPVGEGDDGLEDLLATHDQHYGATQVGPRPSWYAYCRCGGWSESGDALPPRAWTRDLGCLRRRPVLVLPRLRQGVASLDRWRPTDR
jgi:hypothetical protein